MRCQTRLSGMAACSQPVFGSAPLCYYHGKMREGHVTIVHATLVAVARGAEGDLARDDAYRTALALTSRADLPPKLEFADRADRVEAQQRGDLRKARADFETLLHLAAAGDLSGWKDSLPGTSQDVRLDQPKHARKPRVLTWHP